MSKTGAENSNREVVDSKKEHKLLRKGLALALAGSVALGAAGCSSDRVGGQSLETRPSTTNEAPANSNVTENANNHTDQFHDEILIYIEMSAEEFEALPRGDRLSYGSFLIDQTAERGNYEVDYGHESSKYRIDPVEANMSNSAQEILDIHQYAMQMAYLQFEESSATKQYDQMDGIKMLSSVYYNVGEGMLSKQYLLLRDFLKTNNEAGPIHYSINAVEAGPLSSGLDANSGDEVKYIDIKYFDSREPDIIATGRFVYCEFTNYEGKLESTWLLESIGTDNQDSGSAIK